VRKDKIKVYDDKVVLDIKKAEWSEFTNTHSMEPLLGMNANGIELKPLSEAEVNIGDVVAYNSSIGIVIHRVVKKDNDDNGTYFILKGDNNEQEDFGKIRFKDIERVLVGVIY
jgi:signal peptidase I